MMTRLKNNVTTKKNSLQRRWKKKLTAAAAFLMATLPNAVAHASSGDIGSSDFAKGFQKLLEDLTKWLIIIAPIVTGCLLIYLFIRRGAADEHEQRTWNKRIVSALVCGVLAVGASLVIQMFNGYFGS